MRISITRPGNDYHGCLISRRIFLLTPLALLAAVESRLNVVLIVARGWRGLATPWAGDPDIHAPNLEQFAKNAVVFPRAYACDPQSGPALSGILTGRFPHANGVIKNGAPLRTEEVTLGSLFKVAGYQVANDQITDDKGDWLEKNHTAPFFLNLTLDPPKSPKMPDPASLHPRENVPSAAEPKARQDLARRYGVYTALDEQFGLILAALDRLKLAQNTIVVFTSDHGEQLGSHALDDDGVWFEESARVPLAIRYPGIKPGASDVLASQVDILPTVLGLCGEPAFEGLQGRDLSPLLKGQNGGRPESIFAEGKIGLKDEWRMLVLGSDKLVVDVNGDITHLYNLAGDPYELTNLAHEPSAQLKRDQLLAILRVSRQTLLDFKRRS